MRYKRWNGLTNFDSSRRVCDDRLFRLIFLEHFFRVLMIAHLGACVVLLGAATHNVICVAGVAAGRTNRLRQEKFYAAVSFYAFLVCFIIGTLVYPAFRWYVRAEYFDAALPRATGLFEIKEHLLSLAFALGLGQFILSRRIDLENDREFRPLYAFVSFVYWAIVVYAAVCGALLVMMKSV